VKKDTSLFELIHSLTPSEKGYFKKYCSGSGDGKNYLKLFDLISVQQDYDEEKLKKKSGIRMPAQFSAEKSYLFHLILEALGTYSRSSNEQFEMQHDLGKAKLLFERSFYEQAMRLAEKVVRFAEGTENFTMLVDALNLETLIWQFLPAHERKKLETLMEEKERAIINLQKTEQARKINAEMLLMFQTIGLARSETQMELYHSLARKAEDAANASADFLPVTARVYLCNCLSYYHNILGNLDKSLEYMKALIRFIDENPGILPSSLTFYISSVNNLVLLYLYQKMDKEAEVTIRKLDDINSPSIRDSNAIFICRHNTRFELYEKRSDLASAYDLSRGLREEIKKFSTRLSTQYTGHLIYYAFRACFYTGHLKDALHWINMLVHEAASPAKSEILAIARISEMILHYEMKNHDSIENLAESTERYFAKHGNLFRFEKIMLEFFKKMATLEPGKKAFETLEAELILLLDDPLEQRIFSYFDFISWAEGKIVKRKIGEIIKEKSLKGPLA